MKLKEYAEKKDNYETFIVGGKKIEVLLYNTVRDKCFYYFHGVYRYGGKIVHCMNETKHGLKKDLTSSIISLLCE